jgi:cytochrome c oxidase assembly factor CtaG
VAADLLAASVSVVLPLLLAHDGQPLAPHDLWSAWSWEPFVVIPLLLSACLYLRGVKALWRNAGSGHGIGRWEAAAFAAGWVTLALSLVSPLHRLGGVLFTAHMAQHELLMVVAAPLLVLGRPVIPFLWALPGRWRRVAGIWPAGGPVSTTWKLITLPSVAWALHAVAIWVWHAPSLYQATLSSETVHTLQHVSFFGTALLFWWALVHGVGMRLARPSALIYLFTTAGHTSLLGALLTFSPRLWYPLYDATTAPWGLAPLEDQQLAGVIMWVPAGLSYLIAALALAATWLRDPGSRPVLQPSPLS